MTTTPTIAELPGIIRRTAELHRDQLNAIVEHLLDVAADHVREDPAWADDALAVATARRLQSVEAEDVLDDPVVRDLARVRALLSVHHPDAEDLLP